jgi:hypothetical protein
MPIVGTKFAVLKEEERPLLLAHCSRHLVGFISESDTDFYGSGVIVSIDGTWAIATAAHVVTAITRSSGVRMIFPGPQSEPGPRPSFARDYQPLCAVVSNRRVGRHWRADELDLGLIVPTQGTFAGIPDIAAINLRLREANPRIVTGRFCIVAGFPLRLQDERPEVALRTAELVVTTNIVSSHFVAPPPAARSDDIAVNWTEVFHIVLGRREIAPDAGGMSGGPVFSYIDDLGGGVWTARRQLPLAGILHHQVEPTGEYLLAHSSGALREFIIATLEGPQQDGFREAIAAGFREPAS